MLTIDDLNTIDEAIASGELSVKIDGKEITYRSMNDLMLARRTIQKSIARAAGVTRHPMSGFSFTVDRGL